MAEEGGAYLLHLWLPRPARLEAGALGAVVLPAGRYLYSGSARRGLPARVRRHEALARGEGGYRVHWHVDRLLVHPGAVWFAPLLLPGGDECKLAHSLAEAQGVSAPAPGFGASDCRAGCPAHLFRSDPHRPLSLGGGGLELYLPAIPRDCEDSAP